MNPSAGRVNPSGTRNPRNDNDLNSQYDQYTRTQNRPLSRRLSPTSMNNTVNNTYMSETFNNSVKQPSASRLYSPNRSMVRMNNTQQQSQR